MKRLALSLLVCPVFLAAVLVSGCGGEDPVTVDPNAVLNGAFDDVEDGTAADTEAEVEVQSLGFEDQPLKSRKLLVDAATWSTIREAIASPEQGLRSVVTEIETAGSGDIEGVETDHVTGRLDVEELVSLISEGVAAGADADESGTELPGLGDLEQLQETLVEGRFDLYAAVEDGDFERLDLTLSLDDRENALPPTRIRFSLTETDPEKATS